MAESRSKVWSLVALVLVALAAFGYYLDPRAELIKELTGIQIHFNDADTDSVQLKNSADVHSEVNEIALEDTTVLNDETNDVKESVEISSENNDVKESVEISSENNDVKESEAPVAADFERVDLSKAAAKNDIATITDILSVKPELALLTDNNGWTVLHEAARSGKIEIVRLLVELGKADINARTRRDGQGASALFLVHRDKSADHPVAQYLSSLGARVIAPDQVEQQIEVEVKEEEIKVEEEEFDFQPTDLKKAAVKNDVDAINTILARKPEWAHTKDGNGWSLLHEAVRFGNTEAVRLLVELGKVDINGRTGADGQGGSVLFSALKYLDTSEHPVVEYLNAQGARVIAPGDEL